MNNLFINLDFHCRGLLLAKQLSQQRTFDRIPLHLSFFASHSEFTILIFSSTSFPSLESANPITEYLLIPRHTPLKEQVPSKNELTSVTTTKRKDHASFFRIRRKNTTDNFLLDKPLTITC